MNHEITNIDNIIHSKELENYITENFEELKEIGELETYTKFAQQFQDYAEDYHYGTEAIHETYFNAYVENLVYDTGMINEDLPSWLEYNIDWEGVADDFKHDYTAIEFGDETYYVR